MQPRSFNRGKECFGEARSRPPMLQCSRGLSTAERNGSLTAASSVTTLQCSRGLSTAESAVVQVDVWHAMACFNAAAVFQPRKAIVEDGALPADTASMQPRSFNRGKNWED